ncbi:MAG: glycosyltransferase [Chloroflexi bacterium]|nr:glycosyltransferase [Chloroflexota bacterium]
MTPCYNQGPFLEETIRSVLLQGYPNLEYIVIDGGSADGSVEIIRKYAAWLAYWVTESDSGQSHAITKGFARSSGEILGWLNSDDVYAPGALEQSAGHLVLHPRAAAVYGQAQFIDEASRVIGRYVTGQFNVAEFFFYDCIAQPATFFRRAAFNRVGGLNESLHFCLDYDLWLRMAVGGRFDYRPTNWAYYRTHPESKSSTLQTRRWVETAQILSDLFSRSDTPAEWRKYRTKAIGRAHWHASIEFCRSDGRDQAKEHIKQALELAPRYLKTRALASMLVGGLASQTTTGTAVLVDDFFALIPDTAAYKAEGHRRALAYVEALLALNDATPRGLARRYARSALKRDRYWISNRHVLSRAFR